MDTRLHSNFPNIEDELNQVHSIYPVTGYITFGAWIYMIPQYKPKNVLMLGYGGGTVAGLIRLFYGKDVKITAVDNADCSEFNFYDVDLVQADARDYVKNLNYYDCIIVDLYEQGEMSMLPFVFEKEFADKLVNSCNYLIVHATVKDKLDNYPKPFRVLSTNSGSPYTPSIYYFMNKDIPSLPVR